MPEYVITLTAIAIVGGLILGAIYFFYNSYRTETAALRADIKASDAKTDRTRMELDAKIDSATDTLRSEMNTGFVRLDAKIDSETDTLRSDMNAGFVRLEAKIDSETDTLRSDMNAGFARLDAKIDSKTDDLHAKIDSKTDNLEDKVEREISGLRSDLGGRIDTNTEKLSELATEVQVHLRTHHLMSEIERITTPPAPRAEEERELEEEANQPS